MMRSHDNLEPTDFQQKCTKQKQREFSDCFLDGIRIFHNKKLVKILKLNGKDKY